MSVTDTEPLGPSSRINTSHLHQRRIVRCKHYGAGVILHRGIVASTEPVSRTARKLVSVTCASRGAMCVSIDLKRPNQGFFSSLPANDQSGWRSIRSTSRRITGSESHEQVIASAGTGGRKHLTGKAQSG